MQSFRNVPLISVLLFIALVPKNLFSETLRAGFELSPPYAKELQRIVDEKTAKLSAPAGFALLIRGFDGEKVYDEQMSSIANNEVDLISGGYGLFYEAQKYHEYRAVLHMGQISNDGDMFYISGRIFCNKQDALSAGDIGGRKVFAVSPFSSSGYYLQKLFLDNQGVKIELPNFVKKHHNVPDFVKNNPGSIGFCASFVPLNPDDFTVIYDTRKVPGNILMARSDIGAQSLDLAAKILKDSFNEMYLRHPDIDRMLVSLLKDDYSEYLKFYESKRPADDVFFYVSLSVPVLIAAFAVFFLVYRKRKNRQIYETKGLKILGFEELLSGLNECALKEKDWKNALESAVGHYARGKYEEAMASSVRYFEALVESLYGEIKRLDLKQNWVPSNDSSLADQASALMALFGMIKANINKRKYLSEDEEKLVELLSADGIIKTLWTYRNIMSHVVYPNTKFITKRDAEYVIRSYAVFLDVISRSPFLK